MPVGNSLTNSNTNISQKNNSVKNSITGFYKNDIKAPEKGTENSLKTPEKAVRFSINEKYAEKYDKWDKKRSGFALKIGTTSEVLQKLGVDDRKIYWDASKILKIKRKHPSMSDRVIKQVPNILEEPIIVMNSKTKPGRITLFGEVYDDTDVPVLAVLELHPTDRGGNEIEIIKLASAFGKDKNLQNFIRTSDIFYIDPNKKRIRNWLAVNRLQLPLPNFQYGFSNTIKPQKDNGVKNSISGFYKNGTKAPEKGTENSLKTPEKAVRYSLNKDGNNNLYWEIESHKDIFKGLKTVREYVSIFALKKRCKSRGVHV